MLLGGATALILLRITNGLGQGTMFPALGMLIANWIPKEERSFVGSIVMGAGQVIMKYIWDEMMRIFKQIIS